MDERELQEIYKRLGTERVLNELDKKFGRTPQNEPQTNTPEGLSSMASDDLWADLEAKNKRRQDKIENSKETQEVYSAYELNNIFSLRRELLQVTEADPIKKLEKIEKVLDSKDIWKYKFSTQPGSGSMEQLTTSPQDSLYYVTHTGLSLRVKRILAYRPEKDEPLIYPVFEKAVFRSGGQEDYSTIPEYGLWAGEFASKDFLNLQKNNTKLSDNYNSKLRFYVDAGKIVGVASELKNEDPYHNGDRVNKIYKIS